MGKAHFRYRVFGFTVASSRPFPFLWPEPEAMRATDIRIEFSSWTLPQDSPALSWNMVSLYGERCAVFTVAPGHRIVCLAGDRIIVDFPASMSDAELQTFVFGQPIAWLMHQRGLTPLHAAVVRIGDVAVALAGHSGTGKSTLARAMVGRGHGLMSDDLAVVDADSLLVNPGFPSLKLWESAVAASGDDTRGTVAVKPGVSKFHVSLRSTFDATPAPLGLVVAIGRDPARPTFRFLRLDQLQATAMLQYHVFNTKLARLSGSAAAGFAWTLSVAAKVPVAALDRQDRMEDLPHICAEIERMAGHQPGTGTA